MYSNYFKSKFIFRIFRWIASRVYKALGLQLGILQQHPPHPIQLPVDYFKPVPLTLIPRISLITPSFNHAGFIERTINSVLDQSYSNLEYHIQDGGSNDGTVDILECYSKFLSGWDSHPDSGQSQAINLGFAKTSGEIMAWLNSDDVLLPGALAYVAEYFNRHPEVDVVYGHRILIDENDLEIGRWIMPMHDNEILSWTDYIPQETMFWRRSIWEQVGGKVDETFDFAMDWDFLLRLRKAGALFARLPRFTGGFRVHPQQKSSAEISGIGRKEINFIRTQTLGRLPTKAEVWLAVLPYVLKHLTNVMWWKIYRLKWQQCTYVVRSGSANEQVSK